MSESTADSGEKLRFFGAEVGAHEGPGDGRAEFEQWLKNRNTVTRAGRSRPGDNEAARQPGGGAAGLDVAALANLVARLGRST